MTTKNSPLRELQAQANKIVTMLKDAERGETTLIPPASRAKQTIKVGIAMDDKVLTPELSWDAIRELSHDVLVRWIVRQMREEPSGDH